MPRSIQVFIDSKAKPANLATPDEIIRACANCSTPFIRGVPLFHETGGEAYAWVKFGAAVYMSEARTQHFVASLINDRQDDAPVRVPLVYFAFKTARYGYIVMEYIKGVACSRPDAKLVGAAVQYLIAIQAPDSRPGPVGGGLIGHRFFVDCESSAEYESVQQLEDHVNGILRYAKRPDLTVSFKDEFEAHGLCLSLSDMNQNNFLKDERGDIVAIDFEVASFLPMCFIELAFAETNSGFVSLVSRHVHIPKSGHLKALQKAMYTLLRWRNNNIGFSIGLPSET
ncbi:hypothetical protein DFP72DRAFT_1000818 [Ephemerocybe angulata]|uniref:Aminoglycoside phosphotransferase domain-containing protein n=1 Tax=Ephemerocybe angulata TaxID=980116 RepID=A0A8H6MFJ1_9AGAR|nr:hypothetical protein DFP72DRAFT_1000818 [Tulosesus angulatus]